MPEYLRLDLFPATVTLDNGSILDPVRAVVTEDTLYVFKDSNPTPELVYQELLYDFEPTSRTRFVLTLEESREQVVVTKRAGCGCGNKLRGFRAFPGTPLRSFRR